jgi:hypothetical protein
MVALDERLEIEVANPNPEVPEGITSLVKNAGSIEALIAQHAESEGWKKLNQIERALAELPQVELPLLHTFTPKLYSRSIVIPAGTLCTTRIHLFEHPFVVSAGCVSVWNDEAGWEVFHASHIGVTKAGTRRLLYAHTDVVWHTFHVTDNTDPDSLVDELTFDPVDLGHLDGIDPEKRGQISNAAKTKRTIL